MLTQKRLMLAGSAAQILENHAALGQRCIAFTALQPSVNENHRAALAGANQRLQVYGRDRFKARIRVQQASGLVPAQTAIVRAAPLFVIQRRHGHTFGDGPGLQPRFQQPLRFIQRSRKRFHVRLCPGRRATRGAAPPCDDYHRYSLICAVRRR